MSLSSSRALEPILSSLSLARRWLTRSSEAALIANAAAARSATTSQPESYTESDGRPTQPPSPIVPPSMPASTSFSHAYRTVAMSTAVPAGGFAATGGLEIVSNGLYQITQNGRIKPISKGDIVHARRVFTYEDVLWFTQFTGDANPIHRDTRAAQDAGFDDILIPGSLSASLFPATLGSLIPGATYVSQTLKFDAPAKVGVPLDCKIEVTDASPSGRKIRFRTQIFQDKKAVVSGEATLFLKHRGTLTGTWASKLRDSEAAKRAQLQDANNNNNVTAGTAATARDENLA